jgi:hypothetical protein
MVRNRPALFAVIVAGGCSVLFSGLPSRLGLIIAALLGVAVAVIAEAQLKRPEPEPVDLKLEKRADE